MAKPPLKAPASGTIVRVIEPAHTDAPKPHLKLQPIATLIYQRTHLDQADAWALAAAILEVLQ